jgi:hypothetical protein
MSIYDPNADKKRSSRITELVAVIGLMVSILVAVATA